MDAAQYAAEIKRSAETDEQKEKKYNYPNDERRGSCGKNIGESMDELQLVQLDGRLGVIFNLGVNPLGK
jgi:hypothetical protein